MSKSKVIHPEQKEDEVYLGNSDNGLAVSCWKTIRVGKVAHYSGGGVIEESCGFKPIFVKRKELSEAGFSDEKLEEMKYTNRNN